jgi:hypothetical protein
MGHFFSKKLKNYELVDNRKNLLLDNIQEDIEDNKTNLLNFKNMLSTIEKNYGNIITSLNKEMISLKNEVNNLTASNLELKRNIEMNNLEQRVNEINNRLVIIESNEQFHSVCE